MAEKKKILYMVEAMGGGVFTYIVDLANELVDTYDMYIAYAVRKQTPANYKDYFDKRIHLIEVKNFGRAINPVKDFASLFEVKRIASEINPDVIHLHSSKAGVIGRIAFNGKIPMFYTPHGYSFLMENYKPMKRAMFKLIETVCAKRKCTTISCSVGEHQETLKLTQHATYVNNGINMAELKEIVDRTDKVEHPFTVYTLGRICYQKNPTMFNAIAELLPDVKFVWIGDGELRKELTSENIEITGWADRATAIKYAVNAFKCRYFNTVCNILFQINGSAFQQQKILLWNEVKKYRFNILENKQARKKTRMAALISYGGQYLMKRVYDWNEKQHVKV